MSYEIKISSSRRDLSLWIQCTYARVYELTPNFENIVEIEVNKYDERNHLNFRSYNRILTLQGFKNLSSVKTTNPTEYDNYINSLGLFDKTVKIGQIGEMTGRYFLDSKNRVWVEARLLYCDRRRLGWFLERDVWHVNKGCKQNPKDNDFAPDYYDIDNGTKTPDTSTTTKQTNGGKTIAWLTIGLSLLSALR